jgi:hypothetical protein
LPVGRFNELAQHEGGLGMWKTVGGIVLRYGAVYCVFGVFGVLFVIVPWLRPSRLRIGRRSPEDDSLETKP